MMPSFKVAQNGVSAPLHAMFCVTVQSIQIQYGQNVEFLNVKLGGTYIVYWAVVSSVSCVR
jgi:hypothetical protein